MDRIDARTMDRYQESERTRYSYVDKGRQTPIDVCIKTRHDRHLSTLISKVS